MMALPENATAPAIASSGALQMTDGDGDASAKVGLRAWADGSGIDGIVESGGAGGPGLACSRCEAAQGIEVRITVNPKCQRPTAWAYSPLTRADMNDTPATPAASPWPRAVLRAVALALLCGLLQALLPRYTLGTAALAPLSVVLGVAVAAAMSRGRWTVPAALLGVLAADLASGRGLQPAVADAAVLGLQAMTAGWLMRHATDRDLLQLDTADRLRRFVLVAAPAAAAVGVAAGLLAQWGIDAASALPLARPQLAGAVGRFIADMAGIVVTAPVLLCWLAQPPEPWRPRRRQVALPLVLLVLVMLPGFDQVARRDEQRLQSAFDRDAQARRLRIQQLLTDPLDAALALGGVLAAGGDDLPVVLFDQRSAAWMERVPGLQTLAWLDRIPAPTAAADSQAEWVLHRLHAAAGPRALPGAQPAADGRLALAPSLRRALDKAMAGDAALTITAATGAAVVAAADKAPAGAARGEAGTGSALLVLQSVPAAAPGVARSRLVIAVVDAGRQLASALPDNDDLNLRVCLTGTGGAAGQAAQRLAGAPGCERDVLRTAVRSMVGKVAVGEQRFDLLISEPATANNRLFTAVWLLALPAVAGAAMLSALLLALTGRLRRIEDRVRERTAALRAEIDERSQAEAALAVSEQRFRAIFDSVSIGVTVVDQQGRIIEANPAFCSMMGGSSADLLQRPLADFQLPDVAEDDGTAAAIGGPLARRQRYLTTDGRVLQVAANLRMLYDAAGRPAATVGALQELTPMLRLREAEREREEAEVASRTKSEFLANLSHELRAPLNAIVGFAQMLGRSDNQDADDDGPDSLNQRHGLAQIRQAGWHLLDMVNDVLDLSRMEAGSLRLTLAPLSLADLAQEAIAMVEPAALQAGVALELSLSPQADRVQADTLRLRQVLINLLGNAIKYNRPGGRVMLRTRPGAVGEVLIEVEDTGIGMSEAQIGELFTPFHRLGREQHALPGSVGSAGQPGTPGIQGTGIGLVICRKLCDLMGGELSVSSREGQGSVFGLRLPRATGEPSRTVVTSAAPLVPSVSIGSVLYIEDNAGDAAEMAALLQRRPGITLVCARTAAEGLALAPEAGLILLDLDLPDRPGIELLRALTADSRLRATPVIVVSAESRPQRIDECFDAGAAQFLTKPLDAQQTLRAIDDSLV
jgi:PAS domain S-box-containing protein